MIQNTSSVSSAKNVRFDNSNKLISISNAGQPQKQAFFDSKTSMTSIDSKFGIEKPDIQSIRAKTSQIKQRSKKKQQLFEKTIEQRTEQAITQTLQLTQENVIMQKGILSQKHSQYVKPKNPEDDHQLIDGVFTDQDVEMRTRVRDFLGTKEQSMVYDQIDNFFGCMKNLNFSVRSLSIKANTYFKNSGIEQEDETQNLQLKFADKIQNRLYIDTSQNMQEIKNKVFSVNPIKSTIPSTTKESKIKPVGSLNSIQNFSLKQIGSSGLLYQQKDSVLEGENYSEIDGFQHNTSFQIQEQQQSSDFNLETNRSQLSNVQSIQFLDNSIAQAPPHILKDDYEIKNERKNMFQVRVNSVLISTQQKLDKLNEQFNPFTDFTLKDDTDSHTNFDRMIMDDDQNFNNESAIQTVQNKKFHFRENIDIKKTKQQLIGEDRRSSPGIEVPFPIAEEPESQIVKQYFQETQFEQFEELNQKIIKSRRGFRQTLEILNNVRSLKALSSLKSNEEIGIEPILETELDQETGLARPQKSNFPSVQMMQEIFRQTIWKICDKLTRLNLDFDQISAQNVFTSIPFGRPNCTDFFKYVQDNNIPMVQKMLEECRYFVYDFDSTQQTALHWSVRRGFNNLTLILLDKGSDLESSDMGGRTALFIAAKENNMTLLRMLLRRGASPNAQSLNRQKPIDFASTIQAKNILKRAQELHFMLDLISKRDQQLEFWEKIAPSVFSDAVDEQELGMNLFEIRQNDIQF